MNRRYPAAPWSGFLKGVSMVISALLLGAAAMALLTRPVVESIGMLRLMLICVLPAIVIVAALFVVRDYEVRDGTLRIRRLFWHTHIALDALREATTDSQAIAGSIRLLGNGGLFSFCGWFRNSQLGIYRAFVTDWQHAVVLRTDRRTLVLSPADPAAFVRALKASFQAPARTTARRKR